MEKHLKNHRNIYYVHRFSDFNQIPKQVQTEQFNVIVNHPVLTSDAFIWVRPPCPVF